MAPNGIVVGYKLTWVPMDFRGVMEFKAITLSGNVRNLCKYHVLKELFVRM